MAQGAVVQLNTKANPSYVDITGKAAAGVYSTFNDFPSATGNDGLFAVDKAESLLYCAFNGSWWAVAVLK